MMDVISMKIFVGNIYQIVKVHRLNESRRRVYEMLISRQLFFIVPCFSFIVFSNLVSGNFQETVGA